MHAKLLLAGALLLSCFAVQAAGDGVAESGDQANAAKTTARDIDPTCLRYTGSRIVARENRDNERASADGTQSRPRCNGSPGRSYSRDDISRTGATDLAEALRMLDPAVH